MGDLIRVQKYLSQAGICSRRQAEQFIEKGWVFVNDEKVSQMGAKIDPDYDQVRLSQEANKILQSHIYIKYYKPRGVVTHSPRDGETSIHDIIDPQFKPCAPIGRLDKDSEGLILMSTDGVFARQCLQSTQPHSREYLIHVSKPLTTEMINKCETGIKIAGTITKSCDIQPLSEWWYHITLYEGRNRQIRRMIQKVGSGVTRLKRVRFGSIDLGPLKPNEYSHIDPTMI